MKNLLLPILLMLTSVSISQTIPPPLQLSPEQVNNVYKGLREGEEYKRMHGDCLIAVDSLNSIVQEQDYILNEYITKMQSYDKQLEKKWYENPWLWGVAGLLTGALIIK